MKAYIFCSLIVLVLLSCVTGNDDNAVLREHEEALARTPRVLELRIDGVAPTRDQQSHWIDFPVTAGQQVRITALYDAGVGATSADFDFSRSYHHTSYDADDAMPVEPFTQRVMTVGEGTESFEFTYTIPTMDDDSTAFEAGDHINLTWWSSNNTGGQGFNDVNFIYE